MKQLKNKKAEKRLKRHKKIRTQVSGTSSVPRLAVFRSNKFIYAQIIDDTKGATIVSVSDAAVKGGAKSKSLNTKASGKAKKTKTELAKDAGLDIAKKALGKKIEKIVFDRGGFIFTGRVKAFAEGAREGGLKF